MIVRKFIWGIVMITLAALVTSPALGQTASKSTYLKLISVQKLWEAEEYSEALSVLREQAKKTGKYPYDHAIVHQYMAQTAIFLGQPDTARAALETALRSPDLPIKLLAELKLFYGQLVLADEEYELARSMLEDWYAAVEVKVKLSPVFSLAYANYQTGHLERAETLLVEAIEKARKAKDSWYRLYYQVLLEREKFSAAEAVLYRLLNRDSGNDGYWRLLANHYLQMEENQDALSALAIAYQQQMLTGEDDLKRLTSLYGFVEMPEKAARLLAQYLEDGTISETPETLRQVGDLWLIARERQQAKKYLQRAAAVAPDGKTYELLGSIYFEDEDWAKAHENYRLALTMGGVKNAPRIHLLAGVSAMRAGMTAEARRALNEAKKSDDLRAQADSLLKRIDRS